MAEFDSLWDFQAEIASHLAQQIRALMDVPGNEFNAPGPLQAAMLFVEVIMPSDCFAFAADEDLAALAHELIDKTNGVSWGGEDGERWQNDLKNWILWRDEQVRDLE